MVSKTDGNKIVWEQPERAVIVVKVDFIKNQDWSQSFLLCSDRHWDNPHSDWDLQKEHFAEVKRRNAYILEIGDFFCAMQGKYDKRADKSCIRPEHQYGDYLDRLVVTGSEFLKPISDRYILMGYGNHETAIQKRCETDLIQRLVGLMRAGDSKVCCGGYGGWVKFQFVTGGVNNTTTTLHYDHGYGGGGPVTHDAIQHQRRQVYLPDADIIWSGHTHDQWTKWVSRARISDRHRTYQDEVLHIKTATYKNEYADGSHGWHVETGKPPKPIGAYWLNFKYVRKLNKVVFDVERAN